MKHYNPDASRRLSHAQQQQGSFKRLMPLVKEALLNKVWLYNKNNGNWYTPEEFKAKYENRELNNYEIESILENMIIRDPRAGNLAYHKEIDKRIEKFHLEIQELKNKGEVFLNKVIQYYQHK